MISRSCIPVPKIEDDCYDWWERHELKLRQVREKKYKAVLIGDSITHFWTNESEVSYGEGLWEFFHGDLPILNLGYGFDRTQNVLWRLEHGELDGQTPDLFIVNIGTNQFSITGNYDGDTPEIAAEGIIAVLKYLRNRFPHAYLVDMALFPRGGKMELIRETNSILKEKVAEIADLFFLDITKHLSMLSGEPAPQCFQQDLCHLNGTGYRIWGAALTPFINRFVK